MSNAMNKFWDLIDQIEEIERVEGLGMAESLRAEAENALEAANAEAAAPNLDHPIVDHLTSMMS